LTKQRTTIRQKRSTILKKKSPMEMELMWRRREPFSRIAPNMSPQRQLGTNHLQNKNKDEESQKWPAHDEPDEGSQTVDQAASLICRR
jgi:hypothetical protein